MENAVLYFDVRKEVVDTYLLTQKEFEKINNEFELGLDVNNLTKDDFELLYDYLENKHITDSTVETAEAVYDYLKHREL